MNFDLGNLSDGNLNAGFPSALQVVVAYEDFQAGKLALETLDRILPPRIHGESYGTHNVWKFDLLEIGKFSDIAAAEAARADMVIISVRGSVDLPPAVKRWTHRWISRREGDAGALVLLVGNSGTNGTHGILAESHLKECALRSRMDFFVQRVYEDLTTDRYELPANVMPVPESSELLSEIIRSKERFQGWGLNS